MNDEFDIAIIGMAGRFPGARNLDEFWQNLAGGVESIPRLSDAEILKSGVPAACLRDPTYVKAAPVLDDPGAFDAAFFGFSPMEARTLDPQHRLLLELAHEALEDAGYDPERYGGRIGVFTGAALNTYFTSTGLNRRLAEEYIPTLIANDKDFLSTRISYKLNLKGPSITVQTACSTSLVAVHLARQSLLSEETDIALAGAVSVRVPHRAGYFCDPGGVVSPDGHVRAFDAGANGTVFGSGGGVVILKRLADALADGDNLHAVIKGSAVNNDGSQKAGYTAPSVDSQAEVVIEALANAGLEADSIGYVEAHGSGTPIGDPIEIRALTKAFRTFTSRTGCCAIGSVKTNIGHLDAAAAVAGIIKTVLALKNRQLPPSLHFDRPNPEIDFPATPFYVNTQLQEWRSAEPRRAGVMSTGMGGTNAHLVLEEAPACGAATDTSPSHLLVLSAKTEAALDHATERLRATLQRDDSVSMSDVSYTLQIGRQAFPYRRYLVCASRDDAVTALAEENSRRVVSGRTDGSRRPVIFLLPGIGDHYVGMAHGLYETWDAFRDAVDRCARVLEPHLGLDIRTIVYPESESWKNRNQSKGVDLRAMLGHRSDTPDDDTSRLNRTLFAQAALFTVEYATARLWQSFGIAPDAIVGHSMGEYVAACLAGVLSLDDALTLVATRARLVDQLPPGAMLAVTLSEQELLPLVPSDLSISLISGPNLCVVTGPAPSVADFERTLNARDVICRAVRNGHAFHSRMLDPIVEAFEAEVRRVGLHQPAIPYTSNVTGTWITGREATTPAYWSQHATHPARFHDALHELWQYKNPVLLEVGPGRTLTTLAMQHPDRSGSGSPLAVSSIRHHYENQPDAETLWHAIGRLWLSGVDIMWDKVHSGRPRRRVPLPTYPFERQSYWIEPSSERSPDTDDQRQESAVAAFDKWFYVPAWTRTSPTGGIEGRIDPDALWLIVSDRYGGGERIRARLQGLQGATRFIRLGKTFAQSGSESFELNPASVDDYLELFRKVQALAPKAIHIIHLGSVTREDGEDGDVRPMSHQDFGFYSLLHIAQAVGELNLSAAVAIGVVTNRIHEVTGDERVVPDMATVLGPCGVIPKEFPNISCFNVDLPGSGDVDGLPDEVIDSIISEFGEACRQRVVAYRGRYRWERRFRSIPLPGSDAVGTPRPELGRLRRGGVYLITGGTGGIGLAVAKHLAEVCQPTIVLTKKRAFPPKAIWRELAQHGETPARVLRTIRGLLEIEELGAEVDVQVAECASRAEMQRVLAETSRKYGRLDGVIHAAGIIGTGVILTKTRETAETVLAPKVEGAAVLFDLLKDTRLDFLVLFSSMTSLLSPYAQSDYSGANAFLDAFTYAAGARAPFHTLTINWPGWKDVGIVADLEQPGTQGWKEAALKKAIATKDGIEAFRRALSSGHKQVIVSPEDLDRALEEALAPFDTAAYLSQLDAGRTMPPAGERREAREDPPTNEVESTIANLWSEVLGVERIGIHENFATLGGHSLLAMQIVARVNSIYQIALSLREFFDAPTIAGLSSIIQARVLAHIETLTDEEARGLMSNASRS